MRTSPAEKFFAQVLLSACLLSGGLECLVEAAEWFPKERTDQPWKVVSLAPAGGLTDLNIFNLDFERNTNSTRWGTAWIATSDGLREYDGYTWRRHGRAEGLPSDFVRCVLVTRSGQVWVGTDQGAGVYDGTTFRTFGAETNLAGPNVRRITEDTDGTLWFCSDSWPNAGAGGGLTSFRAGQWKAYREADGLPSGYVVNYFRDRAGRQYAATLGGLAELKAGRWGPAFPAPAGAPINWGSGCLAETAAAGLLYSTGRELFRRQEEGDWKPLPAGIPHEHGIAATADGGVVAVGRPSKGHSVFLEWAGDRWVTASAEFPTPRGYTEDIREAPDGSVWVAGYDCLVRWSRQGSQWREFTDLPPPKLVDADGGVWFAQTRGNFSPGGRVVRWWRGRWEPLGDAVDELVNHRRDGSVWGWTGDRLSRWQGTNRTDFASAQTGLTNYVAAQADGELGFQLLGRNAPGGGSGGFLRGAGRRALVRLQLSVGRSQRHHRPAERSLDQFPGRHLRLPDFGGRRDLVRHRRWSDFPRPQPSGCGAGGSIIALRGSREWRGAGSRRQPVGRCRRTGPDIPAESAPPAPWVIGAWTDITDRVSLEKQLRQAQKMEAIGLLSGGIAHDFNNLLGTIIGNAQLAALDIAPEHPATEGLDQILSASRRATHLVQQILTFARREQTERHRISPLPVVEESVRLLRATLPAGVQLSLIRGERLPEILADETQIHQVLINLGTNSWHAMEGRPGRIAVELSAVDLGTDRPAGLSDLPPGAYLRIRVEDTGKGMDAATLERIFEPFFTTKEVGKGTGLGLSVVHGIIKAHGGAVTVRSEPGAGTTFDLFLPAAMGGDEAGRTSSPVPFRTGHGEQLLVIDDQGDMLLTHRRSLERLGYRVVACGDAAEALVRFRADPAAFALVLTDLNMPGLSGVELARLVLEVRPEMPVLLTSGFISEEVRQSALATGVREILRKPVLLPDLSEAVFRNLPAQVG